MTEAAIVISLFVVLFACMWAAVSYQNAKLRAMDDARAEGWGKALQNECGDGDNMMNNIGDQSQESGAPATPDTSKTNDLLGGQGVTSMSEFSKDSGYMTLVKHRTGAFPAL